jgi:AidA-like protein
VRLLPPNTYAADPALRSLLQSGLAPETLEWAEPQLTELGALAAQELPLAGEGCERQPPWLRSIDPWGRRVDEVVHPEVWRRLGATAARFGLAGLPYEEEPAAEAWIAGLLRAAAGRGPRELAVFELWQARDSADGWARDSFSLVVDGA